MAIAPQHNALARAGRPFKALLASSGAKSCQQEEHENSAGAFEQDMPEEQQQSRLYRHTVWWLCATAACAFVVMMLLNLLWNMRLARNADIPGVLSVLPKSPDRGGNATALPPPSGPH